MNRRGAEAESQAARYLQRQGLTLISRNYSCRYGEIDLILKDGSTLVFAEVRLRGRNNLVDAAASIDAGKQAKLIHTAQHYLSTLPRTPACRFDVVLFDTLDGDEPAWIKNAFGI